MLTDADEGAHPAPDDLEASESYYFNLVDASACVAGFTRIGFAPTRGRVDAVTFLLRDWRPWWFSVALDRPLANPWTEVSLPEGLAVGPLRYRMETPFGRWRIEHQGRRGGITLTFAPFTRPYDYPAPLTFAATRHYEQAGTVEGTIEVRGRTIEVRGLGQRDHSWGVRRWGRLPGWTWLSAHFEHGAATGRRALNAFAVGDHLEGFFFDGRANRAIERGRIVLAPGPDPRIPGGAHAVLLDDEGEEHALSAQSLGHIPLYKGGALIVESAARFSLGGAVGHGILETLAPASPLSYLPRMARAWWELAWNR